MSFRDVRASRESRKHKSYVLNPPVAVEHTAGPSQALSHDIQQPVGPVHSSQPPSSESFAQSDGPYAELPKSLVIQKTKGAGRGLWATESLKAGTALISLRPHVHVLSTSYLESFCTYCCAPRPDVGLKKCGKCRVVWYCGAACQNADWGLHKTECDALQRWAASAPTNVDDSARTPGEAVRCLGRVLWKRRKEGNDSIWWKEIDAMQSHSDSLPPSAAESHVYIAHSLVRYLGIKGPDELAQFMVHSVRELVELVSKFTTNTFTLTTPLLSPIGVSISPLAALINHSCDPNAAIVFPRPSYIKGRGEPLLQVIAFKDIPEGTEVLTSYIDTTLPTALRQSALKETYNFTCRCSVCVPPASAKDVPDRREAVWCPRNCGGVCPLPTSDDAVIRCTKCKHTNTDTESVLDACHVGQEALDKATSQQLSDPTHALTLTRNALALLMSARLVPAAHPLLALQRLHQSLFIAALPATPTQAALNAAVRSAAAAAAGLDSVLAPSHPARAVALAELGKLLAADEPAPAAADAPAAFPPSGAARLRLARDTLQRALAALCVAFGSAGAAGAAVRAMLVDIERELAVWGRGVRDALADAQAQGGSGRGLGKD